jgi:stage II sporulation protein GA (sporulation sigma-E factor processing peptidase)
MSVYIEYVILDNIVINYILLFAVTKTLRRRSRRFILWAGSALGTAAAVLTPLAVLPQVLLFVIKIATATVMTLFTGAKNFRSYIISLILFLVYTFALGGLIVGMLFLLNADMFFAAQLIYDYKVPVGVPLAACFFGGLLLVKLVKYIEKKRNLNPFIRDVRLFYDGREIAARGFIDSGNRLYDADGCPVILISSALAEKILPQDALLKMYSGLDDKEFKKKYTVSAIGKKERVYLFKIEKLLIYFDGGANTIENVSVGAMLKGFKEIDGCDVLLHGDMI